MPSASARGNHQLDIQSVNDPFVLTLASSAHTNTLDIAGYSVDSDGESLTTTD